MKPYYEEAGITIYHGDCREVLPSLTASALISDPPYGIGHVKGPSGKGKGRNRRNTEAIEGDDSPFDPTPFLNFPEVILWGANHYSQLLPRGRWLAWDKLNGLASYDSFSDVEFAWHNTVGASRIFRYLWKGICQQGDKQWGRVHPTQKPVPLMKWCIAQAGFPSSLVDPFMGSGTTLVAAKEFGIEATGIELKEHYCEIAANRLRQEVLQFA